MEFAKELAITIRVVLPGCCPFIQISQLHAENGGLHGIQPTVHSQQLIDVLVSGAVHVQEAEAVSQRSVVGRDDARVAGGAEILGGEKTETTYQTEAASRTSSIARADGLCGVLDDRNALRRSKLENRIHIGRQAEKMYGHDGLSSGSDCALDGPGRDVEGLRVNIDKDRFGSHASDGTGRSEKRKRSGDDLVASSDSKSQER